MKYDRKITATIHVIHWRATNRTSGHLKCSVIGLKTVAPTSNKLSPQIAGGNRFDPRSLFTIPQLCKRCSDETARIARWVCDAEEHRCCCDGNESSRQAEHEVGEMINDFSRPVQSPFIIPEENQKR
jgi:hypothetical protein